MAIHMGMEQRKDLHSHDGERVRETLVKHLDALRQAAQRTLESASSSDPERRDAAAEIRVYRDLMDTLLADPRNRPAPKVAPPA